MGAEGRIRLDRPATLRAKEISLSALWTGGIVVLSLHARLEVSNCLAQGLAGLGKSLRPEHDQGDNADHHQLGGVQCRP
jgi:hypothetical protein